MDTENNTQNETAAPVAESNNNDILTVVVVDEQSKPVTGAKVSIKPSDASKVTNSSGEVQFELGQATKYEITASDGSDTVTVPYYVTPNGATRLVINPVYVKNIEEQLHPSNGILTYTLMGGGVIVFIFILLVIRKQIILRRKRRKASSTRS